MVEIGQMPYPAMNTILDGGFPAGSLNYWLSSFTNGLSDGLIDTATERFASVPSPMSAILFEHFHGAVTRVGVTDAAVPHRQEGWNMLIPSVWIDPATTEANIAWTRDTFAALSEHFAGRRWLNYLGDDQGDDAVRAAYGPNFDRLVEVKRRYDPENVFHHNHNIASCGPLRRRKVRRSGGVVRRAALEHAAESTPTGGRHHGRALGVAPDNKCLFDRQVGVIVNRGSGDRAEASRARSGPAATASRRASFA
jgi:hypothetical protein